MKVDNKIVQSGTRVAQENVVWINFNDKAIDKLFIKSGNRVTVKFRNISVSYLTGLRLLYAPKTQKKRFYSKIKYKWKTQWINLNEFIYGHYGTAEVSEELLGLYKKYYDKKIDRIVWLIYFSLLSAFIIIEFLLCNVQVLVIYHQIKTYYKKCKIWL